MLRYTVVSSAGRAGRRAERPILRQAPAQLGSPANLVGGYSVVSAQVRYWNNSAQESNDWEEDRRPAAQSENLKEAWSPSDNNVRRRGRGGGDDRTRDVTDFFQRRRQPNKKDPNEGRRQQSSWRANAEQRVSRTIETNQSFSQKRRDTDRTFSRSPRRTERRNENEPSGGRGSWRAPQRTTFGSESENLSNMNDLSALRSAFPSNRNAKDSFSNRRPAILSRSAISTSPSQAKTATVQSSYTDMKDVSALRAAFLRSVERTPEERPTNDPRPSSWRQRDGSLPRERLPFQPGNRVELSDMQKRVVRQQERDRRFLDEKDLRQMPSSWRKKASEIVRRRVTENHKYNVQLPKVDQDRNTFMSSRADFQNERRNRANGVSENERIIELPTRDMTVLDLSTLLRVKKTELLKIMKSLGLRPKDKHEMVDPDTMELLALELGLEVTRSSRRRMHGEDNHLQRRVSEDAAYESLPPRPPVVCIMGHVDHGKTTLMDSLRSRSQMAPGSNTTKGKKKGPSKQTLDGSTKKVAGTEAGGITQVISAFQVALENQDSAVTFLDTPGHAAFRAMRESGSNAADVVVLVIAADDGVSPQTVEILNFYKSIVKESGGISLVVAMTKIDKPGIKVDEARTRIENQLLEHGIMTESFGSGETEYGPPVQLIPVSGLTGEGVEELIEGLVLQSEIMDLRGDLEARAEGIVMDARMEKGLGVVVDCVVRWGSLERGDIVVSGIYSGKIKTLKDVNGAVLKKCMPSQPVRIIGFKSLPKAGDPIICVASEEVADKLIERREMSLAASNTELRPDSTEDAELHISGNETKRSDMLQNLRDRLGMDDDADRPDSNQIRIPVVIKADADGTLAAVRESMLGIGAESTLDIVVDPVGTGIGPISSSDVLMASESGAAIFIFNVKQQDQTVLALAETHGVQIRSHNVIYSLLNDAKDVFAASLPPSRVENVHGKAVVQAVFDINNKRNAERIAGLRVLDGTLYKSTAKNPAGKGDPLSCYYRVIRKGQQVSPVGEKLKASSLRKVKESVDDVRRGDECGLGLDDFGDYEEGDTIECYSVELKRSFV